MTQIAKSRVNRDAVMDAGIDTRLVSPSVGRPRNGTAAESSEQCQVLRFDRALWPEKNQIEVIMANDNKRSDDSVSEEASAFGQRVKGAVKDGAGAITGNESLEREGERENAEGRDRQRRNEVFDESKPGSAKTSIREETAHSASA